MTSKRSKFRSVFELIFKKISNKNLNPRTRINSHCSDIYSTRPARKIKIHGIVSLHGNVSKMSGGNALEVNERQKFRSHGSYCPRKQARSTRHSKNSGRVERLFSWCFVCTLSVFSVQWRQQCTWLPSQVQDPNFMSQCWSSKGNQVMSILQVLLKMPGGTYRQLPLCVTTTFVWYVPSKPSSALTCSYHIINYRRQPRSR